MALVGFADRSGARTTPASTPLPRQPAAAGAHLTLVAQPPNPQVGQQATITATLTCDDPDGSFPGANSPISLTIVGGVNAGKDFGTLDTNDQGHVSWPPYTSMTAGSDRFEAISTLGCFEQTVRGNTTVDWQPLSLRLQADPKSQSVGEAFDIVATLSGSGGPAAGQAISFAVTRSGSIVASETSVTGGAGNASIRYKCDRAGSITVRAAANDFDPAPTDNIDLECVENPALLIQLVPPGTTSQTGSTFTATATVTKGGNPVPGATVDFTAVKTGEPKKNDTSTTLSDGSARFSYTRSKPGPDTITATVTVGVETDSDGITHTWVRPPSVVVIHLAPANVSTLTGRQFTATATVTKNGVPVSGKLVTFLAEMLADTDRHHEAETDAKGHAPYTYSRKVAGVETLSARVTIGGRTKADHIKHKWVRPPPSVVVIDLAPANVTTLTGKQFTATATVTKNGVPVSGKLVTFLAEMPADTDRHHEAETDAEGHAPYTYSRKVAGVEILSARVTIGGRTKADHITHEWVRPPPSVVVIDLAPAGTSSRLNSPFTATATVRAAGQPIANAVVTFVVTSPGAVTISRSARTDPRGTAAITYSRAAVGTDTIRARTQRSGQHPEAVVLHNWVFKPNPTNPACMKLDRGSSSPGGNVYAVGLNSPPGKTVSIRLGASQLASPMPDEHGRYRDLLTLPDLPLDRYTVQAVCGTATSGDEINLVTQTSTTGTAGAAATTTAAVLAFFLLFGGQLVRMSQAGGIVSPSDDHPST